MTPKYYDCCKQRAVGVLSQFFSLAQKLTCFRKDGPPFCPTVGLFHFQNFQRALSASPIGFTADRAWKIK
jgi:hypothetical protein